MAPCRVKNASGEEQSRRSLETLCHVRSDAAGDQGSEVVSELDRGKGKRLRGNGGANAARGADAALLRSLGGRGLPVRGPIVGMLMHPGAMAFTGDARVVVSSGRTSEVVVVRIRRMRTVLHHAAGDHCRGRHALQGQRERHHTNQRQPQSTPHAKSVVDFVGRRCKVSFDDGVVDPRRDCLRNETTVEWISASTSRRCCKRNLQVIEPATRKKAPSGFTAKCLLPSLNFGE